MVYQTSWRRIVLYLGTLWIWWGYHAGAQNVTYQHLYEALHRGNDFFVVGARVYMILWKYGGPSGVAHSVIASTPIGENEWTTVFIPGEAFFLGSEARNEILSIVQKGTIWQLALYDLTGQILGLLDYTYTRQPQEDRRYIPVPITFPDGSLLLSYKYKTHSNSMTGFFRNLYSGGHGASSQMDSSLEIIPALIHSQSSSFTYLKVTDAYGETILGIFPEFSIEALSSTTTTFSIPPYQIYEYHVTDRRMKFYHKQPQLIMFSEDGISVSSQQLTSNIIAPLPPLLKNFTQRLGLVNSFHLHIGVSDVGIDVFSNDIVYVIYDRPFINEKPRLHIFFYEQEHAEWKTNILPLTSLNVDELCLDFIRIYLRGNDLYLVLGECTDKVTLLHCHVHELKKGGLLNVSE